MVSMVPGSDADYERSECSTDLRKRHPHGRYQTDTGGQKTDNKKLWSVFPHHDKHQQRGLDVELCVCG